jgi:hypothetical protein
MTDSAMPAKIEDVTKAESSAREFRIIGAERRRTAVTLRRTGFSLIVHLMLSWSGAFTR